MTTTGLRPEAHAILALGLTAKPSQKLNTAVTIPTIMRKIFI
jgi:hypothetical protein